MLNNRIINFGRAAHGNVTIIVALIFPVLLLLTAGALELIQYSSETQRMQNIADGAAVYGARQATLANARTAQIEGAVEDFVAREIASEFGQPDHEIDVKADLRAMTVEVTLGRTVEGLLMKNVVRKDGHIEAFSKAIVEGTTKLCAIALEKEGRNVVKLQTNAKLVAPECSIYSNSIHKNGLSVSGGAEIDAEFICSVGGVDGAPRNFSISPVTDCPEYPDPLQNRQAPSVGNGCDETDFVVGLVGSRLKGLMSSGEVGVNLDLENLNADVLQGTNHRIRPGVYCGGIHVGAGAILRLDPGIYIIRDGQLRVDALGQLDAENVGFYMVGADATFHFGLESKISLTAPKKGKMAGMLFMEDRQTTKQRVHEIFSNDARMLLGTFYLPNGVLNVNTILPIADKSAYTVIIAKMIHLTGSPTLVLNTDYSATDIPVPSGVGPTGGQIRVIQ